MQGGLFQARRLGVEIVVFGIYAIFSISWATTGSLMPEIQRELGINTQQATLITSMIIIAKIFGAAFSGFFVYRFGLKWGYFLGCLFISSGIFISFVDSYIGILVIRFLTGLGSACALSCIVPITQLWFSKSSSIMISFNINSNLVGASIGLALASSIAAALGNWRLSLALYAWINLALLVLWIFVEKDDERREDEHVDKRQMLLFALKSRLTWGMIAFYVGPILFLNSLLTFLPTYYAKYAGFDVDIANSAKEQIPALANFAIIFGPYIGLFFKKRGVSFKRMLFIGGLIICISGIPMIFMKDLLFIRIFAIISGLCFSTWFPFFFNLPSELKNSNPTQTAYIMSTFWTITFIFLAFNLWFVSWSVDVTHSFTLGFIYTFALVFISSIVSQFILPSRDNFM